MNTPKKRGRKRKADLPPQEESITPEDTSQPSKGATSASDRSSLRRRVTPSRYSPPPATTRVRGTSRSFPSTSQSKYVIDADADNETATTPKVDAPSGSNSRRKSLGVRNVSNTVNTVENLEVAKQGDKIVVKLPDGSQKNVTISNVKKPVDMSDAVGEISAKEAAADPEYKPASRSSTRRKSDQVAAAANQSQTSAAATATITAAAASATASTAATETVTVTTDAGRTARVSNLTTVKLTNQTSTPITVTKTANIIAATSSVNKSHIVTPISSKGNLPAILKPAVASTPLSTLAAKTAAAAASATARRPQAQQSMTKYVDSLPEIADCLNADGVDDKHMKKMPDRIMLIHSELPLHLAVFVDNPEKEYLFQQIISPVQSTRFICLLCKGIDVNFGTKEEKDILLHYQSLHELDVDIGHAKFSEETVFICLPKMVLSQLEATTGGQLALNSCCQYCEERLNDVADMKKHYREEHSKEVVLMEQEEIMKMHHYFYCPKCRKASPDFDSHHHHMKSDHELKTYRCKSCVLVTQDETRLRTHFKAKHMLHSSGQNYQCFYCHGLLIGVERLMKHIQQSHMVQTGTEFSCIACLQTCGRGKELLTHAQGCTLAGVKPEQRDNKFINVVPDRVTPMAAGEVECYLCSVRLESEEVYQMHLHHEHMKWVGEPSKGPPEGDLGKLLTVDDVISEENLEKAKIQTYVGHWCRMCDQMIKVYQLYYLHMVNYHRMEKEFQCIITQCKAQFTDFEEFKKHIEETGHSQKTIISHPDEVAVCTYCDIYYPTEEELVSHLITDQHINKFTASGHFHRTEPRNFKCKACHTYFGMKESYIHHLETESHKYICHYCGITTATPSARRAHIQNTHPEKVNTCEACGEVHQNIIDHFVTHGFSFECKKCVKKFYNRERLNAHMEVHQDPIECTWETCGRMIATRSMMVTHYRGHRSEHKCNVCGQAFWNYSMLSSHLRSHQPLPRSVQPQKMVHKTYTNLQRSQANAVNRGQQQRIINTPNLTNNIIRCGHCGNIFKNTRELNMHHCTGKIATPPSVALNNGQQNKLYELASKASTAPKATNKPAPRRKPSPKKTAAMEQATDMAIANSVEANNPDDDTQLIMILNQVTGELMEITAPKGMEVKDVIESLNFQSMEEGGALAVEHPMDEQGMMVEEGVPQDEQEETVAAIQMINDQSNVDQINEAQELAAAQEANLIAVGQQADGQQEETTGEAVDGTTAMLLDQQAAVEHKEVVGAEEAGQMAQIIQDGQEGEQAIVLPAGCFNEDGSLTLDADTLSRLNMAISVDGDGQLLSDGNTTFIIDTSNNQ